jgi:hypothetical protein
VKKVGHSYMHIKAYLTLYNMSGAIISPKASGRREKGK